MARNNIIFDFGGVLFDWNPRYLYREYFKDDAKTEAFIRDICTGEWNSQMDAGRPFAECVAELSEKYPEWKTEIEMYQRGWGKMLNGVLDDGANLLRDLKNDGRFTLFGLTNWSAETFPYTYKHYRELLDNFEGIVVSGEEKMIKPDKRIYYTLLERYHLKAQNCIFIDDNPDNVAAAERIGIKALLWQHNPDEIKAAIEKLQQEEESE